MLRSLSTGVSGMRNHQTRLDVISNNIANVNTTGFKSSRVTFADQVSQTMFAGSAPVTDRGGVNSQQIGLGAMTASIDNVMSQGALQNTGKVTDLALQGDGFFVMSDGMVRSYSRAGAFDFDREGNLVNPANGLKVMGWPAEKRFDAAGEPTFAVNNSSPIGPIQIPVGIVIPPRKTTELQVAGNLDERIPTTAPVLATDTPNFFDTSMRVYDSLGNEHLVTQRFTHTGPGTWTWNLIDPNATTIAPNGTNPPQTIQFDAKGLLVDQTPANGAQEYNAGTVDITWTLSDGSVTSTSITPKLGESGGAKGLTQFGTVSTSVITDQNGYTRGELNGVSIDKNGVINGSFTNGRQQVLGQLAVATFANPGGLLKNGENGFSQSTNSGEAIVRVPGTSAAYVTSGALEMSNVDLAAQFSDMITTQRGFQASSRVITTSDEILQELVNLKR